MAESLTEIRDRFDYYKNDFYSARRGDQVLDNSYYYDTFDVPQVNELVRISRTGGGTELIDEPVSQISSVKMRILRPVKKDTNTARDAALRISKMINEIWVPTLIRRSPSPIFMFNKNQFLRGEAYIQVLHNKLWVNKKKGYLDRTGLPVVFLIRDPMTIYASPNETDDGVPEHVYVYYQRLPGEVKAMYPDWSNPKAKNPNDEDPSKRTVEWMEYWSKDKVFAEADGQVVKNIPNIYGYASFIHKVSGWGTDSPEGKPEDKVVSRIRKYRDLLERECAISSDVDSQYHLYANKNIWVQPDGVITTEVPEKFRENFSMAAGHLNEIPPGLNFGFMETDVPDQQALNYLFAIKSELGRKTPSTMSGDVLGGSGRLQDIGYGIAMKKFEQQMLNTQYAFETAMSMALQMIETIPTLLPSDINKGDIDGDYQVEVELKNDDPLENERLSTRGSRMWQAGEIDLTTNLVDFQGKTAEDAKQIKKDIMVERIMFSENSPFAQIIAMWLAQELGMEEQLSGLLQQGAEGGQTASAQRRPSEVQTPQGREMIDQSLLGGEVRRSPVA